jgi:tRNA(fMet)-specific endonuclease VapC
MSELLYLLDTDTVSRFRLGNAAIIRRVLAMPSEKICLSVITVEEQLNGWYTQLRQQQSDARLAEVYERLTRTAEFFGQFRILTFDTVAIARYRELEKARLNVGKMDLRIGAIALTQQAIVVTSNVRDYSRIPGIVYEDWAKETVENE